MTLERELHSLFGQDSNREVIVTADLMEGVADAARRIRKAGSPAKQREVVRNMDPDRRHVLRWFINFV